MGKTTSWLKTLLLLSSLVIFSFSFLASGEENLATIISGETSDVSCYSGNDGAIDLSVTTENGISYTLVWSGPNGFTSLEEDLTDLKEGTYSVTVTDANGDAQTKTFTINQPAAPLEFSSPAQFSAPSCSTTADGSITSGAAIGGNGDYLYRLGNGQPQASRLFENLSPGTYTIFATDSKGCEISETIELVHEDTTKPSVVTRNITVELDGNNYANITAAEIDNGSFDNCEIKTLALDTTEFGTSDIGVNPVTLTVTDGSGNSETSTAEVTVVEHQAPTAIARDITRFLEADGSISITADEVDGGSTDNDSIQGKSLNKYTFNCENIGANTVTLTVTDRSGNTDSATATVTIEDDLGPEVITQPITITIPQSGTRVITPGEIDNGSTDNCGINSMELDRDTFTCSDIGAHTVRLTITDIHGNPASQTATVTVEDSAPVVNTKDIIVDLDSTGTAQIAPADIDNGSWDDCDPSPTFSLDPDPGNFTCDDLGDKLVTLRVTDSNNNSATATATVTVRDTISPTVVSKDYTVPLDENGVASITSADVFVSASDNCAIAEVFIDIKDFTCSELGANTVTLTARDQSGNTTSIPATVTVTDTLAPTVITQPYTAYLDSSGAVTVEPAWVDGGSSDNCSGTNLSFALDKNSFTCADLGDNQVILTVTDAQGNSATGQEIITVKDNFAPVIAQPEPLERNSDAGGCTATFEVPLPSVTDNCSTTVTGTRDDGKALDAPYPIGTTVITWYATDEDGNQAASVSQDIIIKDRQSPDTLELPEINTSCTITLTPPKTNDNCTGTITGTTDDPLTYYPQNNFSSHTVTWEFTDEAGNITEVPQTINIYPLFSSVISSSITCNGGDDGRIEIEASGGKEPYNYSINGTWTNDPIFENLTAGTYNARVKDAYGCILEEEVIITEPEAVQLANPGEPINITTTAESCFGANDGKIHFNSELTGGNGNYQFSVDNVNFSNTPVVEGLSAGAYDLFIQDTNGCRFSQTIETITVEGPKDLTANLTVKQVKCYETTTGEIGITNPSGGNDTSYLYRINQGTWREGTANGYTFTGLIRGTYDVEMRDASGCIKLLGEVVITEPDPLVADITTTRPTTAGSATGSATAAVSGGNGFYKYEWRDANGNLISEDVKTLEGLAAGNYQLVITDGKGCVLKQPFQIYDKLFVEINAVSICENPEDVIRTSGFEINFDETSGGEGDPLSFTYEWDFGVGADLPPGTTGIGHKVNYSEPGDKIITLTVTDQGGVTQTFEYDHYVGECYEECDSSSNFSSNPESFYIGDASGSRIPSGNCDPGTDMYLWFIVEKSANGYRLFSDYVYTVKGRNGTEEYRVTNCYAKLESTGEITNDGSSQEPVLPLEPGQLVRLNKVGPGDNEIHWECDQVLNIIHITYKWSNQKTKSCGETVNNMCAATNETMAVATPIRATATPYATCFGENNGSIIVDAYGGTGSFTFTAKNNTTGQVYTSATKVFNNLPAGSYTVTVTDNKEVAEERGQEQVSYEIPGPVEIREPESALQADIQAQSHVSCYGEADGTAEVFNVNGGTVPYTYLWNDAAETTGPIANNLLAGTYTVTITDAQGCSINKTVEVTQPVEIPTANAGSTITSCGFNTTRLNANDPGSGIGLWEKVSGSESGEFSDTSDPNATFTGPSGKYVLKWTISINDGSCTTSSLVDVSIEEDCSFLDFDGKDDYVDIGNNYGFTSGSYTMEAWVKLKTTTGTRTVFSKTDAKGGQNGYELVITPGGVPAFRINNKTIMPDASVPLNTQRWYHLAVSFNGSSLQLYVDGIRVKTESIINPSPTNAPFFLGATYDSSNANSSNGLDVTKPGSHFKGWIEEFRIWKTAVTQGQLQFMMNQRLMNNGGKVKGHVLPLDVPGPLAWELLEGYYQLLAVEATDGSGVTIDLSLNSVPGVMKNITTLQKNTAPLPYISQRNGTWRNISTATTPWLYGQGLWDAPNSLGINNQPINWNIVEASHDITSGNANITLLGLLSRAGTISMVDPRRTQDEYNPGHSLRITHYLDLDGAIDLVGESQLLQDEGSILDEDSQGYLERDQQGTQNSFNYNYWSSPVSLQGGGNNSGYTIKQVLKDGTKHDAPVALNFAYPHTHADGGATNPKRISSYWLFKFHGTANTYGEWRWIGENGKLNAGEGFTMKGTSGTASISQNQNYVLRGKPNNGTITLPISENENRLVGNPYPSAIDADRFIRDNLRDVKDGQNTSNIFNGALYYWDHFGQENSHILSEYVGGYATYSLAGGAPAASTDFRINATGEMGSKTPQRYIPVGQGFFVNSVMDEEVAGTYQVDGGDVVFRNSQRVFVRESSGDSQFLKPENPSKEQAASEEDTEILHNHKKDNRYKIRLNFRSSKGFHRQILVTADSHTTNGFDLGYDAPLIDNNPEDFFWLIDEKEYVIQGVPNFNKDQVFPFGMKVAQEGAISIEVAALENMPDNIDIYIRDKSEETYFDLRKGEKFTAQLEPGYHGDRYDLVFHNPETMEEGPQPEPGDLSIGYSYDDKKIHIDNPELLEIHKVELYSITGKKLTEFGAVPPRKFILLPLESPYSSSVYIVKVYTNKGKRSSKIIIKR